MVTAAVLVALLPAALSAQAPAAGGPAQSTPRDGVGAPARGTATIRGRVLAAGSGDAIRRAEVRLQGVGRGLFPPRSATTDDEGRYQFTELPAGRYQLTASRGGFVSLEYGQRRSRESGRPLDIAERQTLDAIDFALPRGAVVTGHIVDDAGEPVAHAGVSVAHYRYVAGRRQLTTVGGDTTDDRGEFRVFGIPPGDYHLLVRFTGWELGSIDQERYVTTYYPGTPVFAESQRLSLGVGQEISGLVIPLARAATASVSGIARSADGGPPPIPGLVQAQRLDDATSDFDDGGATVAGPDGAFTIGGLLPGRYRLELRSMRSDEAAHAEVTVDGADVAGVTLTLSSGATARGRVRFESGEPPPGVRPSDIFVIASPAGLGRSGAPPTAAPDWTFEIPGLRGRVLVRAGGVGTWHLKSVALDGVDVTDLPIDFDNGDVDGIEIVLTQRTTAIAGTVADARGRVVTDVTVVVFADNRERWTAESRFIASARPDQEGRFTIEGLPPGRYRAIAVDPLEMGEERDPDLLSGWYEEATVLTLGEGESRTLPLRPARP